MSGFLHSANGSLTLPAVGSMSRCSGGDDGVSEQEIYFAVR
jgi:hypothetical protein